MTPVTIEQAMQIAVGHHQAGRLAEAAGIYRQILDQVPHHTNALNMLGVLAYQSGHAGVAIDLIGRAIAINPTAAEYHSNLGEVYRNSGRLEEAIACFRRAMEFKPDSAEVHSNLGNALKDKGRLDEAIAAYRRAIALRPGLAEAHSNLGALLHETGMPDEAIAACNRAITLRPDYAEAHTNLGNALRDKGRIDEAVAACNRAIVLRPDMAEAHNNLGNALKDQGRIDEAIAACNRAITLKPDYAEAYANLGSALTVSGRLDEAIAACKRAVALKPGSAEAHASLGNVLNEQGRIDEAIAAFGRAIEIKPDFAEAHTNLGSALWDRGRPDEAIAACNRAIALKPNLAAAHNTLGNALRDKGRLDEAIAACSRAITLKPDMAEAHSSLGNILRDRGRPDEAIAACHRAIALRPNLAAAHINLGNALNEQGRFDEAIAAISRAIEIKPDFAEAHNNLGTALLCQADHEGAIRAYQRALLLRPDHVAAHSNLLQCQQYPNGVTLSGLARAHAEWDRKHAAPHRKNAMPWDLVRDPERPLRLGFVSHDLCRHPVGFFLIRVLENLDPLSCMVICYHNRVGRDDLSDRLAAAATQWHDVFGLDDDALADRIRADKIDILFDLSGHTAYHRLQVFARRPAPIQITWIGYVGTTGLTAMDYLIADRFQVPPEAEVHYSEKVLRMPDDYVCFEPPAEAPKVGPLPALERGYVTFGCFNNLCKITPEVIALWAEIVRRVPGSRLLLVSPALGSATAAKRISDAFVAAGADRTQLELRGTLLRPDLLAAYNTIDLALDPFPYSGGLTTCESLWMGVPVVTCPGETFASRHSLSHLSNVGLTEPVAADTREYVDLAVRLAGDLPHLAELRAGLRGRMARSPLCDGERFALHLMALLRDVWRQWCRE